MKASYLEKNFLSGRPDDAMTKRIVWGVWLLMLLIALVCIARYGRNIPLAEDWTLVAPLTGHEPDFWGWLWSQNNEHRVPLPRLIMLGLLTLTGGDFRAGMVFNVLTLAMISAVSIQVSHHMRGKQTRIVDAFFPIALLHLGNWENLVWSWQLSFVVPSALVFISLLLFVSQENLARPKPAILLGICMLLLPLCGANGLLFIPFLALWSIYIGIRQWLKPVDNQRWTGGFLIGTAAIALILVGIYFVGYKSPTWNPINPGLLPSLKTSAKVLALGFGPGMKWMWSLGIFITFTILVPTIGLSLQSIIIQPSSERYRAIGILLFLGNLFLVALILGWGRAALVPQFGLPMRYVILSVPIILMVFFIWELYGSAKFSRLVPTSLLVILCLLLPLNTLAGLRQRNWYVSGMNAVEQDIRDGKPYLEIATQHKKFLVHWWDDEKLTTHMRMLHDAGISSFAKGI